VILRRLRRRFHRGVIPKVGDAFLKLNGRNVRLIDDRALLAMLRRYDNPVIQVMLQAEVISRREQRARFGLTTWILCGAALLVSLLMFAWSSLKFG
jgi:hypothetical protein